jgi:hypothetical protein
LLFHLDCIFIVVLPPPSFSDSCNIIDVALMILHPPQHFILRTNRYCTWKSVCSLSTLFLLSLRSKNVNTFTSLMRTGGGVAGVVEVSGSLLVLVLFLFFQGGMMLTHSAALCFLVLRR